MSFPKELIIILIAGWTEQFLIQLCLLFLWF